MADTYLATKAEFDIVANAIMAKGGTSAPLEFPQGMADAVAAISGGSTYETGKLIPSITSSGFQIPVSSRKSVIYLKGNKIPGDVELGKFGVYLFAAGANRFHGGIMSRSAGDRSSWAGIYSNESTVVFSDNSITAKGVRISGAYTNFVTGIEYTWEAW